MYCQSDAVGEDAKTVDMLWDAIHNKRTHNIRQNRKIACRAGRNYHLFFWPWFRLPSVFRSYHVSSRIVLNGSFRRRRRTVTFFGQSASNMRSKLHVTARTRRATSEPATDKSANDQSSVYRVAPEKPAQKIPPQLKRLYHIVKCQWDNWDNKHVVSGRSFLKMCCYRSLVFNCCFKTLTFHKVV